MVYKYCFCLKDLHVLYKLPSSWEVVQPARNGRSPLGPGGSGCCWCWLLCAGSSVSSWERCLRRWLPLLLLGISFACLSKQGPGVCAPPPLALETSAGGRCSILSTVRAEAERSGGPRSCVSVQDTAREMNSVQLAVHRGPTACFA